MSDYDGDEQWDIFIVSPKTGQVVNLTHTREIAEEHPRWSADGRYLAYTVKPKTSSVFEIDVYDMLMRDVKHITTGTPADKLNENPIWSHDGKWIAYTQEQAKGTDSNIFLAEVATGHSSLLTPHEGEQLYHANDFSPDGKKLVITSNAANGYDNVGLLDIASKKISWLTKDKWEINGGNFSPDGKQHCVDRKCRRQYRYLSARCCNAARLRRCRWPAESMILRAEPTSFSKDGSRLLYHHNGSERARRSVGLSRGNRKIAPGDAIAGGWRALGRHGRACSGALSQPRR